MKEESDKQELLEKSNLKRIDRHYISHEIEHVLHLDRGFFYTVRELLLRPGKAVREFLFEDRKKLVKPVLFLIISAILFTLLVHFYDLRLSLFSIDGGTFKGKIRSKEIGEWTSNNTGYAQLIMCVFIAFWTKIFFKKFKYNFYEILVLIAFILGQGLLILDFFIIATKIFNTELIFTIGKWCYFIYIIWGVGQFFGEKTILNYLKSALTFVFGVFTYMSTLTIIAYLLKIFFPE